MNSLCRLIEDVSDTFLIGIDFEEERRLHQSVGHT